jgi:hypothetical protein
MHLASAITGEKGESREGGREEKDCAKKRNQ